MSFPGSTNPPGCRTGRSGNSSLAGPAMKCFLGQLDSMQSCKTAFLAARGPSALLRRVLSALNALPESTRYEIMDLFLAPLAFPICAFCYAPPAFELFDVTCPGSSTNVAARQDTASAEPCERCPVNSYSSNVGAKTDAACTSCPQGAVSSAGSQELSACACLPQYYTVSDLAAGLLTCKSCPEGARCTDGLCALGAGNTCAEGGGVVSPIIGTWTRASVGDEYILEECPDGYRLVNSTDGSSSGTFSHDRQTCESCPSTKYIIHFMFECKKCQEGMLCSGVKEVTPLVMGSEIVPIGDTYWLAYCPTGYRRRGFEETSIRTASSSEIVQQTCIPC
eukprot:523349-Rhodomonas_salina.2